MPCGASIGHLCLYAPALMEPKQPLPASCVWLSFTFVQDQLGRQLHYAHRAGDHSQYKRVRKLKDNLEMSPNEFITQLCAKHREDTRSPPGCEACAAKLKPSRRSETIGLGQTASEQRARGGSEGTT